MFFSSWICNKNGNDEYFLIFSGKKSVICGKCKGIITRGDDFLWCAERR